MLKKKLSFVILGLFFASFTVLGQEESKIPSPDDMADREVERLERELNLEDWQIFYVDSTLRHDYTILMKELDALQKSGATNTDLYYEVQDRCMDRIDKSYRKYFTEKQWKLYMRNGGQKLLNERQKRRDKAAGIKAEKKKKK